MYAELGAYARQVGVKKVTFLWHGGEPLLLGKSFYAAAWKNSLRLREEGLRVRHLIQSNLLLLDQEWVELLRQFDLRTGTSVDPIGEVRVHRNGRLQYPEWLEKFSLACQEGLPLGVVFTATSRHKGRAADIYHFFKNLQSFSPKGIGVRINPVHLTGYEASIHEAGQMIAPADFGEFLYQIWKLWMEDGRLFPVSPLEGWVNGERQICELRGRCQEHFLSIDGRGDIYTCGRFADTGPSLGNIQRDNLKTILQHPQRLKLCRREQSLQQGQCRKCRLWKYCHGGCPALAELYFGDSSKASPFCLAYRVFFEKSGIADSPKAGEEPVSVRIP
jgi:uncharacterized protein